MDSVIQYYFMNEHFFLSRIYSSVQMAVT